jgi:hypothetical protein
LYVPLQALALGNGDLQHEVQSLEATVAVKREALARQVQELRARTFDRDRYRQQYETATSGSVHSKLAASVSALQLALIVLSKEKEWGAMADEAAALGAKAHVRTAMAASARGGSGASSTSNLNT